jgi:hypothetical protein
LNVFEVLGYTYREQAHSHFLRWLLDPEESHELGDQFLVGLLQKIAPQCRLSTRGVQVRCEKPLPGGRVDVVATGTSWRLVIENKIFCPEHSDQTERYAAHYKRFGTPGKDLFLVFLSPAGTVPVSEHFRAMSYSTIRQLLEAGSHAGKAGWLIEQFAEHVYLDVEAH